MCVYMTHVVLCLSLPQLVQWTQKKCMGVSVGPVDVKTSVGVTVDGDVVAGPSVSSSIIVMVASLVVKIT